MDEQSDTAEKNNENLAGQSWQSGINKETKQLDFVKDFKSGHGVM